MATQSDVNFEVNVRHLCITHVGSSGYHGDNSLVVMRHNNHREDCTHHINDLHQRETETELQRVGLVGHRSLQNVVVVQKIVQQPLLVGPLQRLCKQTDKVRRKRSTFLEEAATS